MNITLVFLAANNSGRLVKRVFRRNLLDSQVILTAPVTGEVVLFFQTQNIDHLCNMAFDAIQQGTVLAALPTSQDGAVDSFGDDIPPERAMPVNPVAARQTGLP